MAEEKTDLLKKTASEIRELAQSIDKTSGEELDSDQVLNFLRFYVGRSCKNATE